jgi:sulfofructose kinase
MSYPYPLALLAGVTLSEKGFYWIECGADEVLHNVAARKIGALNTLAAVDVFHGVYAYGLASGLSTRECARFAVSSAF